MSEQVDLTVNSSSAADNEVADLTDDIITRADVVYVAQLSRLALSEGEIDRMTDELRGILGRAAQVQAIDTTDIAATAHPLPVENVLRADIVGSSLDRDVVLAESPSAEDGRFRVPRIVGEQP